MPDNDRNKRIARNTMVLYFRMILLMGVSLYTSRVVLKALGVDDFGVYNVVGGFVSMFAFLNGAMSSSTMRYITYALGRNNPCALSNVFSSCMITHAIIAGVVLVVAETLGLWFVMHKLVIPPGQMHAAVIVFQCSVAATVIMIMSYPYNADIIAHEKMSAFAYISIYEALAKLGIAFLIMAASGRRLVLYAALLALVQVSVIAVYKIYCNRSFPESKFRLKVDRKLIRELFSFTGWNLWGGLAATMFGQGLNVLLNLFFGPAVNAARAIAVQIQGSVNQFAANFQTAVNPQITKTYAAGETSAMHSLIFRSAKFTLLMLVAVSVPIAFEIDWILKAWLGDVPPFTGIFSVIILGTTLIDAVSNPLMIAVSATGKVKVYQSVVGGVLLTIVPISYVVLRLGGAPWSVFAVHFAVALVALAVRLIICRRQLGLSIAAYSSNVLAPGLAVIAVSVAVAWMVSRSMDAAGCHPLAVMAVVFLLTSLTACLMGTTRHEKMFIHEKLLTLKKT